MRDGCHEVVFQLVEASQPRHVLQRERGGCRLPLVVAHRVTAQQNQRSPPVRGHDKRGLQAAGQIGTLAPQDVRRRPLQLRSQLRRKPAEYFRRPVLPGSARAAAAVLMFRIRLPSNTITDSGMLSIAACEARSPATVPPASYACIRSAAGQRVELIGQGRDLVIAGHDGPGVEVAAA